MFASLARFRRVVCAAGAVGLLVSLFATGAQAAELPEAAVPQTPDFNRDVRPILSQHCFKCHGPDENTREAGLRFDVREAAVTETESGVLPIVPGDAAASELMNRIHAEDEFLLMPPPSANKPLSVEQKQILRDWIHAGAEYAPHWAFVPPAQPALPEVTAADWPRNEIDRFVLAKLEATGLTPSPEADRRTLVRRVYLDLIGLLPTPEEVEAFLNDTKPGAYERLVDRLLESPHYGERWARRWLDLARYADTNGYEKDRVRSMWPYRDWVINALNADMPFDEFTIQQLAGDMLPGAGINERISTGFHRNTMLNEEGGVDPLEFRFHAMVDRVATTGTVWLGLTLGCAQCHTHKYDPLTHTDYYSTMALLDNADEPRLRIPDADITARRTELLQQIDALESELANRFPPDDEYRWHTPSLKSMSTVGGSEASPQEDGAILIGGENPATNTYTVVFTGDVPRFSAIQLEVLTDASLGKSGPGRAGHGNFVLTEFSAALGEQPLQVSNVDADFSQDGYPAGHALDGNDKTGWGIHGAGDNWNVNRQATFVLAEPIALTAGEQLTLTLQQNYGSQHTIGKFRIRLGERINDGRTLEQRRADHLERKFQEWVQNETARTSRWHTLTPSAASSSVPTLEILPDGSVLASGDQSKQDAYHVLYAGLPSGITAFRLETLPDERLPEHGPGRVAYEGPLGDFFLSEITGAVGEVPLDFASATHSFSGGGPASAAIDGDAQSGWNINGGQGRAHHAVFVLKEPLTASGTLNLKLLCEKYYAAGVGRFKLWYTTDPQPAQARDLPTEVDSLLLKPAEERTVAETSLLLSHYLKVAPELAAEHDKLKQLRRSIPDYPTTLVFEERPPTNPRTTYLRNRGEYLQPKEPVAPQVPGIFPPLDEAEANNRLAFARWLVSDKNPLVARVTVNRQWAAIFGRGLVPTPDDFGYQGALPSHPELLDWLAVELVNREWSLKQIHRLLVTSATYRQSSQLTAELLERDPQNELLARGPRSRLDAELVRDAVLRASGLLSDKLGGPSVFPPQPPGVSSEGAYGPLEWKVSEGEDRYRRGLYTFAKRTAPYAMSAVFDAPSGEACLADREVTNTPLQALTMLNDAVLVEAAQHLGQQLAVHSSTPEQGITELYERCLAREPSADELQLIREFYQAQLMRLQTSELDADLILGGHATDLTAAETNQRAAWILVARAVLNLDEFITKE